MPLGGAVREGVGPTSRSDWLGHVEERDEPRARGGQPLVVAQEQAAWRWPRWCSRTSPRCSVSSLRPRPSWPGWSSRWSSSRSCTAGGRPSTSWGLSHTRPLLKGRTRAMRAGVGCRAFGARHECPRSGENLRSGLTSSLAADSLSEVGRMQPGPKAAWPAPPPRTYFRRYRGWLGDRSCPADHRCRFSDGHSPKSGPNWLGCPGPPRRSTLIAHAGWISAQFSAGRPW